MVRSTFHSTYQGQLRDLPPTGKTVTFTRIFIYRIGGGKIVEGWENADASTNRARVSGARSVLDEVASLIDKSLLYQTEQEGGEPRLGMLETLRQYGLEFATP